MNKYILNTDIQNFINNNIDSDITSILLKGTSFNSVSTKAIIEQIEAKKKCKTKLPTWFQTKNIYYPNKLNIEQSSSEITADYKSKCIEGNTIIDITGGFGVDCYYFSKRFKDVVHCELETHLSELVANNYKQLGIDNIQTQAVDGIEFLKQTTKPFDWVYADPSRRHESKGKVFFLADCLPNIPEHLDVIFNHTNNLIVKTSPLLDLTIGINELKFVKTIHVVAVNNEVKELLWILENHYTDKIDVKTINITKEQEFHFDFFMEDEKNLESSYSKPLTYLYEPNAAILKAGAFNCICKQLPVYKIQKHTHLYTSEQLIDFPGRRFKILDIQSYNKKTLQKSGIKKANITTRNFPETVQQIRKKFAIQDGGNVYLFFTTDYDSNKIVIVTSKSYEALGQ
ncbi:hypothetical protein GCM10007962_22880 [Yeosuana aromativorans]|uniref:Uncharacterized protein n=1 Tax=Yeosuana aromativorans TaxID=288019 RepID=A0A8J3FHB0_9FLAO|nr:class I SAM-dependent methyltransferase [Yeosuana aromativorans]GGK28028.1 hypothetical protein GCM10007962_22880 [Yeosuana aromativorans]